MSHITPSPLTTLSHMIPSSPNMENIENCTLLPTIMENTDKIEYDYYTPSPLAWKAFDIHNIYS